MKKKTSSNNIKRIHHDWILLLEEIIDKFLMNKMTVIVKIKF